MPKTKPGLTLVSVDWDFFIWNGGEARGKITVHPNTEEEREITAAFLFDWGHSEGHTGVLGEILWMGRFAHAYRLGLDLEKICGIRPEMGCVQPGSFLEEIQKRFNFKTAEGTWLGDSHAYAMPTIGKLSVQPIKVVSFDAHHDLGYGSEEVDRQTKKDHCDCGSWLYHALRLGYVQRAEIVYPDWKGKVEWKDSYGAEHLKPLRRRIRAFTWSEWLEKAGNDFAVGLFMCRSSAWTPPWLDEKFRIFTKDAEVGKSVCWDCEDDLDVKIGAYDACTPRSWDRKAYLEYAEQDANILEEMRRKCSGRK